MKKENPQLSTLPSLIESLQNDNLATVVRVFLEWADRHKMKIYYWAGGGWLAAFGRKAQGFLRLDDPPLAFVGRAYETSTFEVMADLQLWEGTFDGSWYQHLYNKYQTSCKPPTLWAPLFALFVSIPPNNEKEERNITDSAGKVYRFFAYKDRLLALEKTSWPPSP